MLAAQRAPAPVPPRVQRPAIRARVPQPFLPVHRGRGSEVRPEDHPGLPREPGSRRGVRRCAVTLGCSPWRWSRWRRGAGRTCTTSRSSAVCAGDPFFDDGRSARPTIEDTVSRDDLRDDPALSTGKSAGKLRGGAPRAGRPRAARAGPRTLRDLLRPVPRRPGRRARDDRPARLLAAAFVPHRPTAKRAGRLLLRRDHERVRRHAGLRGAGSAAGPLGDRGLPPRAAAQPERHRRWTSRPRSASGSSRRPRPHDGTRAPDRPGGDRTVRATLAHRRTSSGSRRPSRRPSPTRRRSSVRTWSRTCSGSGSPWAAWRCS